MPLLEVMAVFAAIMLDIWWIRFHWPHFWIPLLAFVVSTHIARGETLRSLGLTSVGFVAGLRAAWPYVTLAAGSLILYGALAGTLRPISMQIAGKDLFLYCWWGLFQQYILNGYFLNRIRQVRDFGEPHRAALCAAILFSLIHLPNYALMIAALVGGYAAARVYLRYRNLFLLGLAHGLFGFLLFWTLPDSLTHHLYIGSRFLTW